MFQQTARLNITRKLLSVLIIVICYFIITTDSAIADTNVSGVIDENTIWGLSGSPYILVGDVTVLEDITLTIQSGVEVIMNISAYELMVYGNLNASNVIFSGSYSDIKVYDGGYAAVSGCTLSGQINYYNGSSGALTSCTLDYLDFHQGSTVTVQGNTFSSEYPFRIQDPDANVSDVSGNTLTHLDPKITICGSLEGNCTMGGLNGLTTYILLYNDLTISSTGNLTIPSGIEVVMNISAYELIVYGNLYASNAIFSGSYSDIRSYNGGYAAVAGCSLSGQINYYNGSSGALTSCTLGYLDIHQGTTVTVQGNTFTSEYPLRIQDPDANISNVSGNTLTHLDPKITICGSLEGNCTMGGLNGLTTYILLYNDLTVSSTGNLTIPSGIEVIMNISAYELIVYGNLYASNAIFSGSYSDIRSYNGGYAAVAGCSLSGQINYYNGSSGALTSCTLDYLDIHQGTTVTVQGNTFTSEYPLRIQDPDANISNVSGNTLTHLDPKITICGSLEGNCTMGGLNGLTTYILLYNDLTVSSTGNLTIPSGIEVIMNISAYELIVYGNLYASNAIFSGSYSDIKVYDGGLAAVAGCSLSGQINYYNGSSGALTSCTLEYLDFHQGSTVTVQGNTFSSEYPFRIQDPDANVSDVSGNTLTHLDPKITICGSLEGNCTMGGLNGLKTYILLYNDLTISSTGNLTIPSGIEVVMNISAYELMVYGNLNASNVIFSGSYSDIKVYDGGYAAVSGCTLSGQINYYNGSSGALTSCTLDYLDFHQGSTVTVQGNTFSSEYPFRIQDPDANVSDVSGNTLTHLDPKITICGSLEGNCTMGGLNGLTTYILLYNDLTISSTGNLTIPSGIEVVMNISAYELMVYGNLNASNVIFSGSYSDIKVYDGGYAAVSGCTLSGQINYYNGSSGALTSCTLEYLDFHQGSTVTVQGNTFSSEYPFRIQDPDANVSDVSGNTLTHLDPKITICGSLEGNCTMGGLNGLTTYILLYNDLTISSTSKLTIPSGIEVVMNISAYELMVYGNLNASNAIFSGSYADIRIYNGAVSNLTGCNFAAGTVYYYSGSYGEVVTCILKNVTIDQNSSAIIHFNDLSAGYVTASGSDPSAIIPFEKNWWGTTVPSEIDDKIHDHLDNNNLPTIDYDPFLLGPPVLPKIANVAALQRLNVSKLVDITYDLTDGNKATYYIDVKISQDGGMTFPLVANAVSGAVGPGQISGDGKHIVWNPAIDLPGVSGSNFVAKVVAESAIGADSNQFQVNAANSGVLTGKVIDSKTGNPVSGVEITVPDYSPIYTGAQGDFTVSNLDAGKVTIDAVKAGYYATQKTVTIYEASRSKVNLFMVPEITFGVVEVKSAYCGPTQRAYYLDGVHVEETFTATVDWGTHTPGTIHWKTPTQEYVDPCSGETAERTFFMGDDFGEGGSLEVVLVSNGPNPLESEPYEVNFKVIPPPTGILPILLYSDPTGNILKYTTVSITGGDPIAMAEGEDKISEDMPLFGGEDFKFSAQFDARADVMGDGSAEAPFFSASGETGTETDMCGISLGIGVSGAALWEWNDSTEEWIPGGQVEFTTDVGVDIPPKPKYIIFMAGPVPIPVYFQGHVSLHVASLLQVMAWSAQNDPNWNGLLTINPEAQLILGVGVSGAAAIQGVLGGGAVLVLQFPDEPTMQKLKCYLTGELQIVTWFATYSWPFLEYTWNIYGDGTTDIFMAPPILGILPRDYMYPESMYAIFIANSPGGDLSSSYRATTESPIQLNTYPQSDPVMTCPSGDDLLLNWLWDDPTRTPVNRTRLVYSEFDASGGTWSTPDPLYATPDDDGTADYHSQLTSLPNGDCQLAWENVKEVLVEPVDPNDPVQVQAKLEEMKSKTEIAVAEFDYLTGTWGAQSMLTDNTVLDRTPILVGASDGTTLLTWVRNATNHMIGTDLEPNTLHFAIHNGTSWSAPGIIGSVDSVIKSTLVYNGVYGAYIFIGDTDNDLQTIEDRELFATVYSGGVWGPAYRLTFDIVEDNNPQVEVDHLGNLVLVWYSGGDIEMATDLSLTDRKTIVDLDADGSSGVADFRLATGDTGLISLVWQQPCEDIVDMWNAIYDPISTDWSLPQRLTNDGSMEYAMSPIYDGSEELVVSYNKAQIGYETREVVIGEEIIFVENVPVVEQVDLYALRHASALDLMVEAEGISVSPENPLASETATITANIRNIGDLSVIDIQVGFYDGDPLSGGSLIGTDTIPGPLKGGDQADASIQWSVPVSFSSHDIHVVADPYHVLPDTDYSNNTNNLSGVMKPDAVIDSILVQKVVDYYLFTIRIRNAGALDLEPVDITLHMKSLNNPPEAEISVPDMLIPGAFYDVTYEWHPWNYPEIIPTNLKVHAQADSLELIDEFYEANNTKSANVWTDGNLSKKAAQSKSRK